MQLYSDEYFMQLAINEAIIAYEEDEVPIGAIVVCENQIIGKGHNLTQKLNDVTAHAEIIAISAATNTLGSKYLNQCTIYVSLEPCVMCAGALYWAQIQKLVYAAKDPKRGYSKINYNVLHPTTTVVNGILENTSSELLKTFFAKKR